MIPDNLYDLAFQYKKARLWKQLWDTEIFAVRLSGGRIGYVSVMGAGGEHCALALYVGSDGYESLRHNMEFDEGACETELEYRESLIMQDCLQCAFETKDLLDADELSEVRAYAEKHGIRLGGKNAFPHFLRFKPYCYPWYLQDRQEQEDLCAALEASIALSSYLKGKDTDVLARRWAENFPGKFPLLHLENGALRTETTPIPPPGRKASPEPSIQSDLAIARLKRGKDRTPLLCMLIRVPQPMQETKGGTPKFPLSVLAVKEGTGYLIPSVMTCDYEEKPEPLLELFVEKLIEVEVCPSRIFVRDERTYCFFKSLCRQAGIRLEKKEKLPLLESTLDAFTAHILHDLGEEDYEDDLDIPMESVDDLISFLLRIPNSEWAAMPKELKVQLKALVESDLISEADKKELKRKMNLR